jgi:glycogen phosphorylase
MELPQTQTSPVVGPQAPRRALPYDTLPNDAESLKRDILGHLEHTLAELPGHVDSVWEPYVALALAVRDRMVERWIRTQDTYYQRDAKRVYYLSLEYLMGRTLGNSLINMQLLDSCERALHDLGYTLEDLRDAEWDAGLGNGGLGRLAACFLDSLATLGYASYGYGLRYDYGIFYQRIVNGAQMELPDRWLQYGNPWEIARQGDRFTIQFFGRVETRAERGRVVHRWVDTRDVLATPFDTPVPGYGAKTVNTLRLWAARAVQEFDLSEFNEGGYVSALQDRAQSESISRVLYPSDNILAGRELRLSQEYFFVSATLQDILRRYKKRYHMFDAPKGLGLFDRFAEKVAIQLNDTHPALAVPELMRILVDLEDVEWDRAWAITQKVFGYTNHTVLPEALEKWPVPLFERMLPRHLEIIYEINRRFLGEVTARFGNDGERLRRMSLIEEDGERRVRMASLAIVGSHSVNGVAALHTEILKEDVFRDFHELWPERFNNKTNGITQRRWLLKSNPALAELITEAIGGPEWVTDLDKLELLAPLAGDSSLATSWQKVKRANKVLLAETIRQQYERRGKVLEIDPDTLVDVQIKRIHEYKRQLLNLLHVITLYNRIRAGQGGDVLPRTVVFAGKAAPGYFRAKQIIHLINSVADVVNADPAVHGRLKVAFLADYRVSLAEQIVPGAELSEQISTAGTEASGTGNMKLALNGALTIGTMDGANVEIAEAVGEDNIFIFGLRADEVRARRGSYVPWDVYRSDPALAEALDMIAGGAFSPNERDLFRPIVDSLLHHGDHYFLLADYASYIACQDAVARAYRDTAEWTRRSILNVANMGRFSSDRTIRQYAEEVWGVKPVIEGA